MIDNNLLDKLHAVKTRLGDRVFVRGYEPATHECEVSSTLNEWSIVSRSLICATNNEIAKCICAVSVWEEAAVAQCLQQEQQVMEECRANNQQTGVSTMRRGNGAVTELPARPEIDTGNIANIATSDTHLSANSLGQTDSRRR